MYHTIKATKGIICRGKYAKLVYDQIPKIIEKTGRRCNVRVLDETRYYLEIKKLVKEDDEFLTETNIEELADIIEVI